MEEPNVPTLETIEIPDKAHFKIGEVAKLLELEPYVLRYWEKEFEVLEPSKTDSGQRAYQRDDIELLATIRELLYTEMFTIDGARRQLERAREGESSYLTRGDEASAGGEESSEALEELRWENEQLEQELEETNDDRLRLEAEIEELRAELEEARAAAGTDQQAREWKERANNLEEEAAQLRTKLAETRAEVEKLRQQNDELRDRSSNPEVVEKLRGEISELDRLADSVELPLGPSS